MDKDHSQPPENSVPHSGTFSSEINDQQSLYSITFHRAKIV